MSPAKRSTHHQSTASASARLALVRLPDYTTRLCLSIIGQLRPLLLLLLPPLRLLCPVSAVAQRRPFHGNNILALSPNQSTSRQPFNSSSQSLLFLTNLRRFTTAEPHPPKRDCDKPKSTTYRPPCHPHSRHRVVANPPAIFTIIQYPHPENRMQS